MPTKDAEAVSGAAKAEAEAKPETAQPAPPVEPSTWGSAGVKPQAAAPANPAPVWPDTHRNR